MDPSPLIGLFLLSLSTSCGTSEAGQGNQSSARSSAGGNDGALASWVHESRGAAGPMALEVHSAVARVQAMAAFNGDRHIQASNQSTTGIVDSVQRTGATEGVIAVHVLDFQGSNSQMIDGQQTIDNDPFGDRIDGLDLVCPSDASGNPGVITTSEGQGVAEGEFLWAFPFAKAWLPEPGTTVEVGQEWTRVLGPSEIVGFLRIPIERQRGQLELQLQNLYEDEGALFASIEMMGLLEFNRSSGGGNRNFETAVLVTGVVEYDITHGFTARGSFRFLEPVELQGGPDRPSFSMDGYCDWRTSFRTRLLSE